MTFTNEVYGQWLGEPIRHTLDLNNYDVDTHITLRHNDSVKFCQPKHFCSYCQSNSIDDMRGNCCCCGAPRGEDKSRYVLTSPAIFGENSLISK